MNAYMKIKVLECWGHGSPDINRKAADKVHDAFRQFEADTHLEEDAYIPPKICSYIFEALKTTVRADPIFSNEYPHEGSSLKVEMDASQCSAPNFDFIMKIEIGDVRLEVSVSFDLGDV